MSDPIQSPPGYTSDLPTEVGWYKVWNPKFHKSPFRVKEVRRNSWGTNLFISGPFDVRDCKGWYWNHERVKFP